MTPEEVIHEAVQQGAFPGGQMAVSRAGQPLSRLSVGHLGPTDPRPVSESTVYDLASLTKPLATALLVGRALEAKLCRLDDPIDTFVYGSDPAIRLRDILTHSAGYPAHVRFDAELPSNISSESWSAHRFIVNQAAQVPRERSVGAQAVYSDVGFILLGAALEKIFEAPISSVFAKYPTRLHFRDQRGPPAPPPPHTEGLIAPTEQIEAGKVHDENCRAMGGVAGHAGLFGSAQDVLKLCESLCRAWHGQPGEILQPGTVQALWAPSEVPGSTRTLGWDRPSPEASSTGCLWPSHAIGHLGFTGTSVWIEPERSLVAVLVTNRVCPTRSNTLIRDVRPKLHTAIWRAWA